VRIWLGNIYDLQGRWPFRTTGRVTGVERGFLKLFAGPRMIEVFYEDKGVLSL
jgi:hypothetical protein